MSSYKNMLYLFIVFTSALLASCAQQNSPWQLILNHDAQGNVSSGNEENLVSAIRAGCQIKVAWGGRRKSAPSSSIEHSAQPVWISIRGGSKIEVQLDGFLINLKVLGEPTDEHPRLDKVGGTQKAVMWRATLKTDGTFDAVWYYPHSGEFITRIPQRYPMKWFSDCNIKNSTPLYP